MSVEANSPVGGDGVETGAGSAAPGLTGSALPESGGESGQNDSGDLSGSVWRVGRSWGRTIVLQAGDQPAKAAGGDKLIGVMDTPELARIVVDAVNARRVSVDDHTARMLADALDLLDRYDRDCMGGTPDLFAPNCGHPVRGGDHDPWDCMEAQVAPIRAAVQALRDGSGT